MTRIIRPNYFASVSTAKAGSTPQAPAELSTVTIESSYRFQSALQAKDGFHIAFRCSKP
jgi:hypothetical protein